MLEMKNNQYLNDFYYENDLETFKDLTEADVQKLENRINDSLSSAALEEYNNEDNWEFEDYDDNDHIIVANYAGDNNLLDTYFDGTAVQTNIGLVADYYGKNINEIFDINVDDYYDLDEVPEDIALDMEEQYLEDIAEQEELEKYYWSTRL